jgi:hypothetical protein
MRRSVNPHSPEEVRLAIQKVNRGVDDSVPYEGANKDVDLGSNDLTTTGDLYAADLTLTGAVKSTDYVQFDTSYSDGSAVGKLQWNADVGTLEFGLPGGEVNLQIGQEFLIPVRNVTGGTLLNGRLVYYTGVDSGLSTVDYADSTRANWPKALVRGILTEDIDTGENGYMLIAGVIHDVNTDGLTGGIHLFLSTDGDGTFTNTRPTSPDYVMGIGTVKEVSATVGTIQIEFDRLWDLEWASNVHFSPATKEGQYLGWNPENDRYELQSSQRAFFNGTFRETFDALMHSTDGNDLFLTLEQADGGGDLTMQFSDGDENLDCTPAQSIAITPGTDAAPIGYMVFIPQGTKVLTVGSVWPSVEHIKIAYLFVPSAQFIYDHGGPYVNQNHNDHLRNGDLQGHLTHITTKVRSLGASWYSGVAPDGGDVSYFTYPGASDIRWESTAGVIQQLHPQTFEAQDTASTILIVANGTTPYVGVSNLFTGITEDSLGNPITNNRYFSLVFWGVANKTEDVSGVMCNLPSGNYTIESSALVDTAKYDDYSFPREFDIDSGTAFLICRSTFKMGTTGWTHIQTEDLRGISGAGGGAVSAITDHGGLGGLADDDHVAYHTDARATTWLTANHETTYNHAQFATAYGWGDHGAAGYLTTDGDGSALTGLLWSQIGSTPTTLAGYGITDGGGVTDHGALDGLADDDHSQYHTDARADAWLAAGHETTYDHSLIGTGGSFGDNIPLEFGDAPDYWLVYNSAGTQFELRSTDIDGAGTNGLVMSVADGTKDVNFAGEIDVARGRVTALGAQIIYDGEVNGFTRSIFFGSGGQSLSHTAGTEGYYNLGFGARALENITTGQHNVACGNAALISLNTGTHMAAVGSSVMASLQSGAFNLGFGFNAGRYRGSGTDALTIATGCVLIGAYSRASADSRTNEIAIGYNALAMGSNTATIGGPLNTDVYLTGVTHTSGIVSSTSASVVAISGSSVTGDAIYGTSTNGTCGNFYRNVSTPTDDPPVLNVHQDSGSDGSTVVKIRGDGSGDVLSLFAGAANFARFDNTGEITFTGKVNCGTGLPNTYGVKGSSSGTTHDDGGVYGYNSSTGPAIYCISDQGNGISAYGNHGRGGYFYRNNASPDNGDIEVLRVTQDNGSDSSVAMVIQQDGTGDTLLLEALNPETDMFTHFKGDGDCDMDGIMMAGGYKSSDGTAGWTGSIPAGFTSITVKDGLITGYT